jgi:uncharacterized protein HemX
MGAGGITLVALVVAAILGVVFWGLNSPQNTEHVAGLRRRASNRPVAATRARRRRAHHLRREAATVERRGVAHPVQQQGYLSKAGSIGTR